MISYPFESKNIGSSTAPVWDRAITAEMERQFNKLTWKNGVFVDPANSFLVTSIGGMRVNVASGGCHIEGVKGYEASNRQITLSGSHSSLKRIDRIVLRLDTSDSKRNIDLYVKEGVASTNPSPQPLTKQPNYYELCIAEVFIPAGVSAITNSNITDTRMNTDLCGTVVPAIPFLMEMGDLWNQISDSISLVQSSLNGTTAGNLQNEINSLKSSKANVSDLNSKASTSTVNSLSSRVSTLESFKSGQADYITSVSSWSASGITGGKIIKYKSGRCEIFGQQSLATNFSVARGTAGYSTPTHTLNFPLTFRQAPMVFATMDDVVNLGFVGYTTATTTKSTFAVMNIGGGGSYTCKINWHIVGET